MSDLSPGTLEGWIAAITVWALGSCLFFTTLCACRLAVFISLGE